MNRPMMMCGHVAQGINSETNEPVCVICVGITPNATIVETNLPDLTNRKARCVYYGRKCKSEVDSRFNLAFFEHKPNDTYDEYCCGCYGWD